MDIGRVMRGLCCAIALELDANRSASFRKLDCRQRTTDVGMGHAAPVSKNMKQLVCSVAALEHLKRPCETMERSGKRSVPPASGQFAFHGPG